MQVALGKWKTTVITNNQEHQISIPMLGTHTFNSFKGFNNFSDKEQ